MTIFEAVKAEVTPRMAAERYGLHVSRSGMYGTFELLTALRRKQ